MRLTRSRPQPPVEAAPEAGEPSAAMTVVPRPASPPSRQATDPAESPPAAPALAARVHRHIDDLGVEPAGTRIGELLVRERLASREQVVEALVQQENSAKKLGTLLIEIGAVDERDIAKLVAARLGLSFVDLRRQSPDADAVALLPEPSARAMRAVPMSLFGEGVAVVVSDPSEPLRLRLETEIGRASCRERVSSVV